MPEETGKSVFGSGILARGLSNHRPSQAADPFWPSNGSLRLLLNGSLRRQLPETGTREDGGFPMGKLETAGPVALVVFVALTVAGTAGVSHSTSLEAENACETGW